MATKKEFLKKKLEEKQIEILLQIIDEEVEKTCDELLLEDYGDEGDYGGYTGGVNLSDPGKGGISRIWRDRSKITGLLLSPLFDIGNAFKIFGAQMGVALLSFVGTTIASTIAAVLPFNDPRTIKYIGEKFRFWESKSMKWIDEQFKTEKAEMLQGWETFREDFWGIGFIADPIGVIAAAGISARTVDAALSVGNVITGGILGGIIEKILGDVEDPGDLESYLKRGREEDIRKLEDKIEKTLVSARCKSQLDNPDWIDAECLGAASREMFPAGAEGQRRYINFVTNNAYELDRIRTTEYEKLYKKSLPDDFYKFLTRDGISKILRDNDLLEENKNPTISNDVIENLLRNAFLQKDAPKASAAEAIEKMNKKYGPELTKKTLQSILQAFIKNETAKKMASDWSAKNLKQVASQTFHGVNQELISGKVPGVTLDQLKKYLDNSGEYAVDAIKNLASVRKLKISPSSLNIIKNTVEATTNKDLSPIKNIEPVKEPTPTTKKQATPVQKK